MGERFSAWLHEGELEKTSPSGIVWLYASKDVGGVWGISGVLTVSLFFLINFSIQGLLYKFATFNFIILSKGSLPERGKC